MSSLVEIWNVALARAGEGQSVADPTEQTEPARQCNLFWPSALERTLRALDWPFARRRTASVAVADVPGGWSFAWAYPPDAVLVRRVLIDATASVSRLPIAFEVVGYTEGGVDHLAIATDEQIGFIEYTRRVQDTTQFDGAFRDVVAWALAADIAALRQHDPRARQIAEQGFARALMLAAEQMAVQSPRRQPAPNPYLDARV